MESMGTLNNNDNNDNNKTSDVYLDENNGNSDISRIINN